MDSILRDTKISIEAYKINADNETINGTGVDMQGYDAVTFICFLAAGNASSLAMKAQQDSASNFGTAADLAGTSTAVTSTAQANGFATLEIVQPRERYVRAALVVPNWDAVPVLVIAIQHKAKDVPYANTGELHVSPAEGTA